MFVIKFTEEDMKVLDRALKVLPYCEVAPIINSINKQVRDGQEKEAKSQDTQNQ